jgi:hypothetical protein
MLQANRSDDPERRAGEFFEQVTRSDFRLRSPTEFTRFEDWSPEFGWWLGKPNRTLQGFGTSAGIVTPRDDATPPLPLGWFAEALHAPLQVAEHAFEEFTAGRRDRDVRDSVSLWKFIIKTIC